MFPFNILYFLNYQDIFETQFPLSQQGTTDIEESRRIRDTEGWYPVRSLFCMDEPFGEWTREVFIESTGPPRRHRVWKSF